MGRKGWHRRGYLPHLDGWDIAQHVVFRLADALPKDAPDLGDDILDLGHGAAVLADAANAEIVEDALLHFHDDWYLLKAWCVMPNHVHVLLQTGPAVELGRIVRSWKMFTTRRINARLQRTGALWAADCFDRVMRDNDHYETARRYIKMNPVKAGLCHAPADWPFSSASR
ncbi:MAG: transposase [Hyphomonadaceae bacterium]|nr:transposase [Hyphomonadaceae bacterium]